MTSFFLKGTRAILAPPNGPPNPALEPGSILVKGGDGRLKLLGSMHVLANEETKQYLLQAGTQINEEDGGEGTSTLTLGRSASISFWASILKFMGSNKHSSSYFLECEGLKRRTLQDSEAVFKVFTENIDVNSKLMPESRTIAYVFSVYRGTSVDVKIGTSDSKGGKFGIEIPTELTGAPPVPVGVGADASSTSGGQCTWKAKNNNLVPVAIQARLLQFDKTGLLTRMSIFGHDGPRDRGESSQQGGDDDATEKEGDDGELDDFLYKAGWPEWASSPEQAQGSDE